MAVLVPIYLAYALLGLVAETVQAFASLPLALVLYTLGQFGVYRARRYRASRTVFRGLRFWMTGSGWGYAFRALGWGVLGFLTLGLSLPWGLASLERYRMPRIHYGTLQGDFVGTGRQLAKRTWYPWVLAVPVPIAITGVIATAVSDRGNGAIAATIGFGIGGMYLLLMLLAPLFLAAHASWQANGIRFGPVAVHSDIGTGAFFGTFVKLFLSMVALLVSFGIAAGVFAAALGDRLKALVSGDFTAASIAVVGIVALGYLALFLGLGVLSRYFVSRGLWAVLAASVAVSNLSAIDEAVAAGDASNAFGESFAEAFNFGGL
jgi:uncharacterized membrane protein YjgN (DUF898 family)